MRTSFLLLLAAMLATNGAPLTQARLDETAAQCDARYGAPTIVNDHPSPPEEKYCVYTKGGFSITVCFLHGHAGFLFFHKTDYAAITDAELQAILNANRGTSSWSAPEKSTDANGKMESIWTRADGGSAYFRQSSDGPILTMKTKAYADAREALEAAKKRVHAMDGF